MPGLLIKKPFGLGQLNLTDNYTISSLQTTGIYDIFNCVSGTFTVTLPSASVATSGYYYTIKNSGSGIITINTQGGNIDGESSLTLNSKGSIQAFSDGSNWVIMGGSVSSTSGTSGSSGPAGTSGISGTSGSSGSSGTTGSSGASGSSGSSGSSGASGANGSSGSSGSSGANGTSGSSGSSGTTGYSGSSGSSGTTGSSGSSGASGASGTSGTSGQNGGNGTSGSSGTSGSGFTTISPATANAIVICTNSNSAYTNSNIYVDNSNSYIYANAFFQNSSRKLKTNIENFEDSAIEILSKVDVVKFNYLNDLINPHIGFIAENTPEELSTKAQNAMDTNSVVGVLIKAVQELNDELNRIKKWQDQQNP
jgi:hypothetical protein